MAFAMIDDLTGDHHPMNAAHRLTLHIDVDADDPERSEVAGWDVASTDPGELLAQLGEHLSGKAAPLSPMPDGPLPGSDEVRETLRRRGVLVCGPGEIDADDSYAAAPPNPTAHLDDHEPVEPAAVDKSAADEPSVIQPFEDPQVSETPRLGESGDTADHQPAPLPATPRRPGPPPVQRPPLARAPAGPSPAGRAVAARVGEALGGDATDAVIRLWAHQHNVPCSMTGKLNAWARAGYLRVQGGAPDQQLWDDCRASIKPSTAARPAAETPAAARPVPPAGRAAAGTHTPGRSSGGPDPTPAPGGEAGAGAGADHERARPEQRDLAEEMAAGGSTPKEIVEATGVSLVYARQLVMGGKR